MNQILFSKFNEELEKARNRRKKFLLVTFKFQFVISILIIVICFSSYMYNLYSTKQKESVSKQLLSNFNIDLLYSNNSDYTTTSAEAIDDKDSFIIGLVEINKLKITYPILSEVNDDLLKIATCRFAGPMPNEVGNLCIAAHNYHDYRFFSRLHLLELGDLINIYDINGKIEEYHVTDKYTISATDLNCTSQDTNGKKQITLLTCNNTSGHRLVVKATANS